LFKRSGFASRPLLLSGAERLCLCATRKRFLNFSEMLGFLSMRTMTSINQLKILVFSENLLFVDRSRSRIITLM
jgi:hypothetical protein